MSSDPDPGQEGTWLERHGFYREGKRAAYADAARRARERGEKEPDLIRATPLFNFAHELDRLGSPQAGDGQEQEGAGKGELAGPLLSSEVRGPQGQPKSERVPSGSPYGSAVQSAGPNAVEGVREPSSAPASLLPAEGASPPREEAERKLGPHHRDGCDGLTWRYSGSGYNRVRLCSCGAEDHAPEFAAAPPAGGDVFERVAREIDAAGWDAPESELAALLRERFGPLLDVIDRVPAGAWTQEEGRNVKRLARKLRRASEKQPGAPEPSNARTGESAPTTPPAASVRHPLTHDEARALALKVSRDTDEALRKERAEGASTPREDAERLRGLLVDVSQLLQGWHADGTAWTSWDESVRDRVTEELRLRDVPPREEDQ